MTTLEEQINKLSTRYSKEENVLSEADAKLAVVKWLSGKLVAGNEKATPYNDVILKLLHELKDGEKKNGERVKQ